MALTIVAVAIRLAADTTFLRYSSGTSCFALLTGWFSSQGRGPGRLFHVLNIRDAQLALPRPER